MPVEAIVVVSVFCALFLGVFITAIVVAVKKNASRQRQSEYNPYNASPDTDAYGRTQNQRDYLNRLKIAQAEKKIRDREHQQRILQSSSHLHSGKAEHYEPIVGSLGSVNDEGCDELDGVRLLEHDESYCDDPQHLVAGELNELEQAIVLGEIVNTPRFKKPYGRK